MFRFVFIFLSVFVVTQVHAQVDGAMAMRGAVPQDEKPLTMAGGLEQIEKQAQSSTSGQPTDTDFDTFLFEQIKRAGIYKNPLVVKKAYTHYKSIELAVREEHAKRLEKIPKDDKGAYEREKRRLDAQTPIRFQLFEDSDEQINSLINKYPELVMYLIMKNVSEPDYNRMTQDEQEEYVNRAKAQYKLHSGYSPEEYFQKYVETMLPEEDEKKLKGQTLMDGSAFQGDDRGEKSKEKK